MKRIDRETVQRILDTADIVDVVSDFVTLKRRGANYIGLCPFHNERTPSFSVSKTKGICKCFSCGKGGSAVNFLMELEQMTFNEALRWLAKKYNIEIREQELTDEQRQEETQRESMLAVNQAAMQVMEENLLNNPQGQQIGLSYFRERGISDSAIKKFHLGYALDKSTALYDYLTEKGYPQQAIFDTGLCIRRDDNSIYDRFKSRVIYPVFSISGKVVAFGGRTLRTDKKVAKYVNSPESIIYSKSRELYGLYQAKNAISKLDKCILVEGYMDVISMSQSGIENVVASSGTSLTDGQIRLIHRFTSNVTVIYDSDAAGIKASLRGIDMLLAEGLNIKVVLLPDGDDPDSFAQSHSSTEVEQYIAEHETDFIRFKTDILLKDAQSDPISRANVISDIVKSISVIPDEIVRTVYIQECARRLGVEETILNQQVARLRSDKAQQTDIAQQRQLAHQSIDNPPRQVAKAIIAKHPATPDADILYPIEEEIARYVSRYGLLNLSFINEDGSLTDIPVVDYIANELRAENLTLQIGVFKKILDEALQIKNADWDRDFKKFNEDSSLQRNQQWTDGLDEIQKTAATLEKIKAQETALQTQIDQDFLDREISFRTNYLRKSLISSPDDEIRDMATKLTISRHKLSKVHSKYQHIDSEEEKLYDRLPQAIFALKNAHIKCQIRTLTDDLRNANPADVEATKSMLAQIVALKKLEKQFAPFLGDRVVSPKNNSR